MRLEHRGDGPPVSPALAIGAGLPIALLAYKVGTSAVLGVRRREVTALGFRLVSHACPFPEEGHMYRCERTDSFFTREMRGSTKMQAMFRLA